MYIQIILLIAGFSNVCVTFLAALFELAYNFEKYTSLFTFPFFPDIIKPSFRSYIF